MSEFITIQSSPESRPISRIDNYLRGLETMQSARTIDLLTLGGAVGYDPALISQSVTELERLDTRFQLQVFLATRFNFIHQRIAPQERTLYLQSLVGVGEQLFGDDFAQTEYAVQVFANSLQEGGTEGLIVLGEAAMQLAKHGGELGKQLFGYLSEYGIVSRGIGVIAMIPSMAQDILHQGVIPQFNASRKTTQHTGARDIFAIPVQRRALKLATGTWQRGQRLVTQTIEMARLTLEGDQQLPPVDLNQILAEPTMEFELPRNDSPKLIASPERVLTQAGTITLTGADIGTHNTKQTLHMDGPAGSHAFLSMHTIMTGIDEHEEYYEHPPQDAGTIITLPDGDVAMLVVDGASLGESAVVSKRIIELFTEMIPTAGNLLIEGNMRTLITRVEEALVQWQIVTDNRMGFATLQFLIVNPETRAMLYATVAGARGTEGNLHRDEGHLVMQQKMRKPIDIQLARYPWQTFMGVRANPLHAEHQIHIEISDQRTIPDNVVAIGIGCDGLTAQQTEEALKNQEVGTRKAPADDRTVAGLILQK